MRDSWHQVDKLRRKRHVDAGECETDDMAQWGMIGKEIWVGRDALHESLGSGGVDKQFREVHLNGTAHPHIANADGHRALPVE